MSILRRRESARNPFPSTVNPFSDRLAGAAVGNTWTLGFWDAWAFAEAEVVIAQEAWKSASHHEKADAGAVFSAALDREQAAAEALARRLAVAG